MPVNKTVQLPVDLDGSPVQVLSPVDSTTAIGTSSSGANVDLTLPAGSQLVEVAFSNTVHWKFSVGAGTATSSNKLGMGVGTYKVPDAATHLVFIGISGVTTAIGSVTKLV